MTPQEELTLLETAYTSALSRGGVTSYSIAGRSLTVDVKWIVARMDLLRSEVARQSNGMFFLSQSRPEE